MAMQWRNQRTLAVWLALCLLLIGVPHGAAHWFGPGRVNIDRVRGIPPKFVTDVNQAEWQELALLPGIGPALAQRIVESRQTHGPFRAASDLRRVRGIGPKTLAAVEPYIICD